METSDVVFAAQDAGARLRRRRLWLLGGVLAGLFAAALAVVVYSDVPPPDVSDLTLVPKPLADEENLYLALIKWGEELKAKPVVGLDGSEMEYEYGSRREDLATARLYTRSHGYALRERLAHGEAWTPEQLRNLGPSLDLIVERALRIALLTKAQGTIDSHLYPTPAMGEVVYSMLLAAWARWESGRRKEAVEIVRLGRRFGQAVRDSHGQLSDHALGGQIMIKFGWAMSEMARQKDADADILRHMLAVLEEGGANNDGYVEALKVEFGIYREMLEGFTVNEADVWDLTEAKENFLRLIIKTRVLFPLIYKHNLTVALWADQVRNEIATSRRVPSGQALAHARSGSISSAAPQGGILRLYNRYGPMVLSSLPVLEAAREECAKQAGWHATTRSYIALRLHHLENGRLPGQLDELVPMYLPAVPLDTADGLPIRYSLEYRAVWSVGMKNSIITDTEPWLLLKPTGVVAEVSAPGARAMSVKGEIDYLGAVYRLDFALPLETKASSRSAAGGGAKPAE